MHKKVMWAKVDKKVLLEKYTKPCNTEFKALLDCVQGKESSRELIDTTFSKLNKILVSHGQSLPKRKRKKHYRLYWNDELKMLELDKITH